MNAESERFWSRPSIKVFTAVVAAFSLVAVFTAVLAVAVAANNDNGGTAPAGAAIQTADPDAQKLDPSTKPSASFTARDPKAPPTPTGTVHRLTMTAMESVMEVSPGVRQQVWTFDNQMPGPVLRGKVGDKFEITLKNSADASNGHSIDFHASKVAWDDEMRTIAPGETLQYDYEAKHAGIFMYHCGTSPALQHIGNGMYGAIIIDPPDLPAVDHEYVLVQSEIYSAPVNKPASFDKMLAEQWDAIVFNGFQNQYAAHPIRVEPNQRVRVWVVDDGPSENSSFHVVGSIFDTVYKEGNYLLQPNDGRGGAQALDLQPAQGGFVEFTLDEVGLYPFVTHKFANASKGALGLFQAGEVKASTGGGH